MKVIDLTAPRRELRVRLDQSFFRPYNLVTAYRGVRVFIYPIETSPGSDTPPAEFVQVVERENLKYYRLRTDRINDEAARWLEFTQRQAKR